MRTILHSDLNNFYASVECRRRPELAGKPVIVCGSKEDRHGIVLAKNMLAKSCGVRTGDVIWEAKRKCPGVVEIPADFPEYLRFSKKVRRIYERYTDRVEAFGIDECWLDVTESLSLFGSGREIAEEIRNSVKSELGVTVSVGVSYNKIFAKLASDLKKPDAVTVISAENYRDIVWSLPAEELLYVGKATKRKLNGVGIYTIGDIARAEESFLLRRLGKWGSYLWRFANGLDDTEVVRVGEEENVKSIGNSLTNYRDLENEEEVFTLIWLLADSVAMRLRESGLGRARTVHLWVRDAKLSDFGRQARLPRASRSGGEIGAFACKLFSESYPWRERVRGVGVSVSGFERGNEQLDLFSDSGKEEKSERLDETLDRIRKKYGNNIIQRAVIKKDKRLSELDVKGEHVVHPENFFGPK